MKTRIVLMITGITVAGLLLASTSSWAGSKQQHRWEGVAIGLGAAIVGSAIINQHAYGYHGRPPVGMSFIYQKTHGHPANHHKGYNRHHNPRPGHWRHPDRGPHYRGHDRQGKKYGHVRRSNRSAHDRGAFHRRGISHRGHGGRSR
jgi:hypothetical protein